MTPNLKGLEAIGWQDRMMPNPKGTRVESLCNYFHKTIKTARSELIKVHEKAEVAQKVAKAKIKHLKLVLEKIETEKAKVEANGASKKKRRKAVEAKVMEVEKKDEGQVVEIGHLAMEAFKSLLKFTKIKIEFGREAFEVE
ncbi:hypothetical protein COCNU_01G009950 [Cocos nucifera]|uniref:Uncharacterized protein n=1 Tax=Cocos nucifera TaxID=13894 RepID=A0A8K0HUY0_COCNU|nr:hypothetical protein COCNU_01G009950 [Cocos nucifera]